MGTESLLHIPAVETSLIKSVGSLNFRMTSWFKVWVGVMQVVVLVKVRLDSRKLM